MKRKSITDFFNASPKKIKQESRELLTSSAENPILINDEEEIILNENNEQKFELKKKNLHHHRNQEFTFILNEKDTGVQVRYMERFLSQRESKELFDCLMEKCEWTSPKYNMYGKDVVSKRKVAFFGKPITRNETDSVVDTNDGSVSRVYNDMVKLQRDWPEPLLNLKKRLEELIGEKYEAALINRYDDGDDLIGWHADREASGFSIASVSLGASRDFQLRPMPKQNTNSSNTTQSPIQKKGEIITKSLENGCLLIMNGATQKHYQHCVPKRKGVLSARLNITFRDINVYGQN
ncbi:predicted protein [Naegleria gruberi]|uniref:Predicted protein n=1 Tax=Naegleria gruberi TaxID=5762 RepID=D2V4D7_NAEGR|nr:uncharacterized protein NAEGRDRAFT_63689 [Naegleria gruberi]EFC48497.1 predicted protein [Naegleria gruberi]|eukprot:XP_002681241.1 predicted protein [Naegleria gruberi strain NEG-M]